MVSAAAAAARLPPPARKVVVGSSSSEPEERADERFGEWAASALLASRSSALIARAVTAAFHPAAGRTELAEGSALILPNSYNHL